jgi:hypothetical protein
MHTGGRRGAPHVPPQKTSKNWSLNAKPRKNMRTMDFLTTPSTPSWKFKKDFVSMISPDINDHLWFVLNVDILLNRPRQLLLSLPSGTRPNAHFQILQVESSPTRHVFQNHRHRLKDYHCLFNSFETEKFLIWFLNYSTKLPLPSTILCIK